MSIHMHDLQVQNEIISNGITIMSSESDGQRMRIAYTAGSENQYGYIFAGNNQSAEAYRSDGLRINCRDFSLVSGFDTNEIEKLKISYTEDGAISVTASGYIILPDIAINGDCSVNGELSVGSNVVLTEDHIGTLIPSPTGEGASGNWDINTTSANKLNANAGNDNTPIYFKDGVPTQCQLNELTLLDGNFTFYKDISLIDNQTPVASFNIGGGAKIENTQLGGQLYFYNAKNTAWIIEGDPNENISQICLLPPARGAFNDPSTLLSSKYIKGHLEHSYGNALPQNPFENQIYFKTEENSSFIIETDSGKWVPVTPYIYIPNK